MDWRLWFLTTDQYTNYSTMAIWLLIFTTAGRSLRPATPLQCIR